MLFRKIGGTMQVNAITTTREFKRAVDAAKVSFTIAATVIIAVTKLSPHPLETLKWVTIISTGYHIAPLAQKVMLRLQDDLSETWKGQTAGFLLGSNVAFFTYKGVEAIFNAYFFKK